MGFTLTREQLYELVWSQPMHKLGKQIGISDVAIAKRCRKLGIPVPRRGYWNRLHARKKVSKAALHPRDLGTINEAEFSGTLTDELRALITGQPGVAAVQDDDIETLAARFRKRLGKVAAPRDFSSTHPAVAKLLQEDEAIRQEAAKRSYYWKEPQFDTPLETRRLRIINALFLAAASVGGGGSVRGERAAELHLNIGALHIGFGLEPREQARSRGTTPERGGNGKNGNALRITLSCRNLPAGVATQWEDSKGAPLEQQLTNILVGMAVAGELGRRKQIADWLEWQRRREEELKRQERERIEEAARRERERLAAIEKAKVDALRADVASWREANAIRAYIAAARAAVGGQTQELKIEPWASWATDQADRLDPLKSGRIAESIGTFDVVPPVVDNNDCPANCGECPDV